MGLEATPNFGMCCMCLMEHPTVRNLIVLDVRAPKPGNGCWGCLRCGLPSEGAVAVLCDNCMEEHRTFGRAIGLVCSGPPGENQRVPRSSLTEPFMHDMSKHPGEAGGPPSVSDYLVAMLTVDMLDRLMKSR